MSGVLQLQADPERCGRCAPRFGDPQSLRTAIRARLTERPAAKAEFNSNKMVTRFTIKATSKSPLVTSIWIGAIRQKGPQSLTATQRVWLSRNTNVARL